MSLNAITKELVAHGLVLIPVLLAHCNFKATLSQALPQAVHLKCKIPSPIIHPFFVEYIYSVRMQ